MPRKAEHLHPMDVDKSTFARHGFGSIPRSASMPAAPIRVLWLKDNRPGHINKVKGFLASVAKVRELEITTWDVCWRLPLMRHLVGRLSDSTFTPPPSWLIRDFPPQGDFDLIISSGGLTQWPNAVLAKLLGIPNVYIGSPHHFSQAAFTLVPMTDPPHEKPPFLKLGLVPSEVSPDAAKKCASEHFPSLVAPGWTLLIGGDGEGMKWSDEDYMRLADLFLKAAKAVGKSVFAATSRRTPERVEIALRERFSKYPHGVTGAWFHEAGGKTLPVLALLGASDRIFATADSVSMTNEAVASGVPTVAVYPTVGKPKPRHDAQFSLLENDGKIARLKLSTDGNFREIAPANGWRLITGDSHAAIATVALERLGF